MSEAWIMNYDDYINSHEWQEKRELRLAIDGYHCRLCDEDGSRFRLEVHHRPNSYEKIPNESVEEDLITVCSRCHDLITNAIREDRYGRQELPEVTIMDNNVLDRKENNYGMAKRELQVDRIGPVDNALRTNGRPDKQVDSFTEEDFWKEKKDGRRSGRDDENSIPG